MTYTDNISEKIYWLVNDLTQYPKQCLECNKDIIKFHGWDKQYKQTFCSRTCAAQSPKTQTKIKKTNLKRHGVEHVLQSSDIKDKIKITNLERYGVENISQSKEIQEKVKSTNLRKYGVECSLQSDMVKEKIKQTNLKRYGVEYISQSKEFQEKVKRTNLERYGVEHALQAQEFKDKFKATMMKRYGVEHALQVTEFQEKAKQTTLARYGVEHSSQSKEFKNKHKATMMKRYGVEYTFQVSEFQEKAKQTSIEKYGVENVFLSTEYQNIAKQIRFNNYYENLNNRTSNKIIPLFEMVNYNGNKEYYLWKCTNCDGEFSGRLINGGTPICRKCYPLSQSTGEREVKEFFKSLNINILENDRQIIKPKELDIVIPEKKIAIEYNGLYWHSELNGKEKDYHKNKLEQANKQGYRLISIFEDEWINKQDICEARLKHILGISDTICYARQTKIKELDNKEHRDFLNKHHIQGYITASIKLGAYYNDELVAVMSFGIKTQKDNEYELLRFCTKGSIYGIGSKLFKYFTRNYKPEEIISYCELRWGTGDFYEKLGFELSHTSKPNYWYFKNQALRHHRYQFRKQALTELASYSDDKTEWQIMQDEGHDRIWDCGNKVFKWNNSTL